jgi:hypothetical protein
MDEILKGLKDMLTGGDSNESSPDIKSSDEDPYGDPGADIRSSNEDPYGDPGANIRSSNEDPYGDPGRQ